MKFLSLITLILFLGFFACGEDDSTSPEGGEEYNQYRQETGEKPDCLPDNSAYSSISFADRTYLKFSNMEGGSYPDSIQISDYSMSYQTWSNDPVNPKLVFSTTGTPVNRLYRLDDLNGTAVEIYQTERSITWPSWTSDNSSIAFIGIEESVGDVVKLINPSGSGAPETIENDLGWGNLTFARCNSHKQSLLYISIYNDVANVYEIDLSGGQPTQLTDFTDTDIAIYSAEFNPAGDTLAYAMTEDPAVRPEISIVRIPGGIPEVICSNIGKPRKSPTLNQVFETNLSWFYLTWTAAGKEILAEVKHVWLGQPYAINYIYLVRKEKK